MLLIYSDELRSIREEDVDQIAEELEIKSILEKTKLRYIIKKAKSNITHVCKICYRIIKYRIN